MVNNEMVENLVKEYAELLENKERYLEAIRENYEIIDDKKTFYYDVQEYREKNRNLKRRVNEFDQRMNQIVTFFRENNINLEELLDNRTR